ncbi:MAG: hypothetical protein Kow0098_23760 [Ignavibacteriaceae bacterium]
MNRKYFLKTVLAMSFGFVISVKSQIPELYQASAIFINKYKEKILEIIKQLKNEGSSIVKKVMNGKTYVFDPSVHYPYDGGISDHNSGYRIFFHAHRPGEYGHFHTFATDENGDLIHLVLISMNKQGEPVALATVNRWVTDDKYVKSEILRKLLDKFEMNPDLFVDKRVVEFVYNTINAYKETIYELFDERDKWIRNYVNRNYNEPFEDREYEILSYREINIFNEKHANRL